MTNRTILMAHLLTALAVAGACDNTGTPVASGRAWFLVPGSTSTQKTVYSDADGLSPLSQPVSLDAGGRATVYTNGAVQMLIEKASGTTFTPVQTWDRANTCESPEVEVENAGWTGTVLDGNQVGSQASGGRTDLKTVLTSLYSSLGGVDGQYQIINTAGTRVGVPRSATKALTELVVNVKSFATTNGLPVAGDGVQVDTTGIQAAMNYVAAAGGGVVYFPPGTYLTDQPLALTGATGVSLVGAGNGTSIINYNAVTGNGMTLTTCDGFTIKDLYVNAPNTTTGTGVALSGCTRVQVIALRVANTFTVALAISGGGQILVGGNTYLNSAAGANGRGITISSSSVVTISNVYAAAGDTNGISLEILGSASDVFVTSSKLATSSARIHAAFTGNNVRFVGNDISFGAGTARISMGPATDPEGFYQANNGIDGTTRTETLDAAFAPDRQQGDYLRVNVTGSGKTMTIAVPGPVPVRRGTTFTTVLYNNNAGVTTWTMAAGYHKASAISTTAGDITTVVWLYDVDALVWREQSRVVTT